MDIGVDVELEWEEDMEGVGLEKTLFSELVLEGDVCVAEGLFGTGLDLFLEGEGGNCMLKSGA